VYHGKNVQLLPSPLPLQDARAHAGCGCPQLPPLFDQAAAFSSPAISIEVTNYNTHKLAVVLLLLA